MSVGLVMAVAIGGLARAEQPGTERTTELPTTGLVSGIDPRLAAFNGNGECGIGAVMPWGDRLYWITYPPHMRTGSSDKLYSIGPDRTLTVHPESVGGTHAARMIHKPTKQLLIGPYVIDERHTIRVLDVKAIPGRYTAWATHLTKPDTHAYLFDMEGPVWEVDLKTLEGTRLFTKPIPGWHGKGAFTSQGRLVTANNGESSAAKDIPGPWELPQDQWEKGGEAAGALGQYDGQAWSIVARRQFVEVAGRSGVEGGVTTDEPILAVGWDRRSVLLMVLEEGQWHTYRLPKASRAMDPRHGWYTEWPRLRPINETTSLLVMHGMIYQMPRDFAHTNNDGLEPIASHLRYIPDLCMYEDQLVLAADDTSVMQNPMAGQSQSNLWFGTLDDVRAWGPATAQGGPWLADDVRAGQPSDPYLFGGMTGRCLQLVNHSDHPVTVTIELGRPSSATAANSDASGPSTGGWTTFRHVDVLPGVLVTTVFPDDTPGRWMRLTSDRDAKLTATRIDTARTDRPNAGALGEGLAKPDAPFRPVVVRPAKHNRNLQLVVGKPGQTDLTDGDYYELTEDLTLEAFADGGAGPTPQSVSPPRTAAQLRDYAAEILRLSDDVPTGTSVPKVTYDAASVVLTEEDGTRWRLPRAAETSTPGRTFREIQSERSMLHAGNLFYEIPRGELGKETLTIRDMRPVCAHDRGISDFCTWRGLLVLTAASDATPSEHVRVSDDGKAAVWLGNVDDLWRLGSPRGVGGPWHQTAIKAGEPSDPYLMFGFSPKDVTIRHSASSEIQVTVELDVAGDGRFVAWKTLPIAAGDATTIGWPEGVSARWVRLVSDTATTATATFVYQ